MSEAKRVRRFEPLRVDPSKLKPGFSMTLNSTVHLETCVDAQCTGC